MGNNKTGQNIAAISRRLCTIYRQRNLKKIGKHRDSERKDLFDHIKNVCGKRYIHKIKIQMTYLGKNTCSVKYLSIYTIWELIT